MNEAQTLLLSVLTWTLNGFLAVIYIIGERWQTLLLIPPLVWLLLRGPKEHQRWALGFGLFALLTSVFTPQPVPILLLVMAVSASIGLEMEKFNQANLHWRAISGIAMYALVGIGIVLFQIYLDNVAITNPMAAQGQAYIGIMAAVALYGLPLAFLALLAQRLFVHPPIPGGSRPDELINALRARGQD